MYYNTALPSIKAVLQKDVGTIDLGILTIGPAKAGTIINLPPQLTEVLIKRGLASLYDEDKVDDKEILKRIWLENRSPNEVRELPKDFYIRARLSAMSLSLTNPEKISKGMIQQLRELVQSRLRKILYLISLNPSIAESRDFLDKLTVEEETLVRLIAPLIREFLNEVVGL